MRLLLDTHSFLWRLRGDETLSAQAREAIANRASDVFVIAASTMEITTKYRVGNLPRAARLVRAFETMLESKSFVPLPITLRHARVAGPMANPHEAPFDRLLVAQAQVKTLTLVSNQALFDGFGAVRLW